MSRIEVQSAKKFRAEIQVPGDKSISHRAAIFSALADGTTHIKGFLTSEDCLCTMNIMRALGTHIDQVDETEYMVHGRDLKFLKTSEALDCGNSGTSMRLITGLLAGQSFESHFYGDASLSKRPMKRIVEPLTQMGAEVICKGKDLRPPLVVKGKPLNGISYESPVASAQVKSCILLAGLQAEGKTTVKEPSMSRDHTERMLEHFGASMNRGENEVSVYGKHSLYAKDVQVPGDFSSAAFWLVAAAARPGAKLILTNVGLNPTRTGLLNILTRMGAGISEKMENPDFEPCGTLVIHEGVKLKGTEIGGDEIPNVIDELPVLAVAAALAEGTTIIRDAKELRVKETDRIAALATNLKAFGVHVEERPDGLLIEGCSKPRGARVKSFGDHRIAMAFSILGLFSSGKTVIEDTDCIKTSYPTFERDLDIAMDAKDIQLFSN